MDVSRAAGAVRLACLAGVLTCGGLAEWPSDMGRVGADYATAAPATPSPVPAYAAYGPAGTATVTPVPTVLPALNRARPGATVLSATASARGTFFLSTRVNGLRIGLRVPPGAVTAPTLFRVTLAATAPAARSCTGSNGAGLGNAYDFTARRVAGGAPVKTFAVGVFLRLDVAPGDLTKLSGCRVGLAFRQGTAWIALSSSQVDRTTGAVTALTSHFTLFQVRAVARAQPRRPRIVATPRDVPTAAPALPTPRLKATPTPRPA